jgi:hypothetical protein
MSAPQTYFKTLLYLLSPSMSKTSVPRAVKMPPLPLSAEATFHLARL